MNKYTKKKFKPDGAWYGMPMAAYQAAPGLNASSLKLLLESPLTFKRQQDGLIAREETQAMTFGTVLHSAILEGKLNYHTRPETYGDGKRWNANATECKAWLDAHSDRPVLTPAESEFVAESFSYVRAHPKVTQNGLLQGGKAEVSVFATINGRLFKGRFDYYKPGTITDLKTVADASNRKLFNAVLDFAWHLQAALYVRLAKAIGDETPSFYWLALQKGSLPLLNVRKFGMFCALIGDESLDRALNTLAECEATQVWPEWADDTTNEIKPLEVPEWAMKADEAIEMES